MWWNNLIPGINWWSVNAPPSPYPVLNLSLLFSLHHFNFLLIIFRKPLLCIRNYDNKPDLKTSSYKFLWTTSKWSCRLQFNSVQFSCSVMSDCLRPVNCSTPGLPVHHQLPEFAQTHVHQVSDAIQPSHPLLSPSPPVPSPSQHQSLFQLVNSSHEVVKVLEFQL